MARKQTSTSPVKPESSIPNALLEKRNSIIGERDEMLRQLQEIDTRIASLDTVISMYNPRHVPLNTRETYEGKPILTLSSTPLLANEATEQSHAKLETKHETPAAQHKSNKASNGVILTDEDKAKQKKRQATKKKKQLDSIRDSMRDYYENIDLVPTVLGILHESPDGLPFRSIREAFQEKYPVDLPTATHRKVFADKISSTLYLQSAKGVVTKGQVDGPNGLENGWIAVRR